VSDAPQPAAPAARDVVEIIDLETATRLKALVESAQDGKFVLRLEHPASVPEQAPVRWYDGGTAWQARSQMEAINETSVNCQLAPPPEWKPAPARQSLRAVVDNAPLLVRITESNVLAHGKSVHAICLDTSASGCRASWPGPAPLVGDSVEVAWDVGDWHTHAEPVWIAARVARVLALPFGVRQVGLQFALTNAAQAEHVRAWHQAWLHEHRRRAIHS
jgi:hypothetical protein